MARKRKGDRSVIQSDLVTVRFIQDNITYTCPKSRLKQTLEKDVFDVLWTDGRRYPAVLAEECLEDILLEVEEPKKKKGRTVSASCQQNNRTKVASTTKVGTNSRFANSERKQKKNIEHCRRADKDLNAINVEFASNCETNNSDECVTRAGCSTSNFELKEREDTITLNEDLSKSYELHPSSTSCIMTYEYGKTNKDKVVTRSRCSASNSNSKESDNATTYFNDSDSDSSLSSDNDIDDYNPTTDEESEDTESETARAHPKALHNKSVPASLTNDLNEPNELGDVVANAQPVAPAADTGKLVASNVEIVAVNNTSSIQKQDKIYRVRACTQKPDGKRAWDKAHYCVYCNKPKTQLPKHYERKHKNETDVKTAMSLPKGSVERLLLFEKMRNHGDFNHNSQVKRLGEGTVITKKSTSQPRDSGDYISCRFSKGTYLRKHFHRHAAKCKLRSEDDKIKKGGKIMSFCALLVPPAETATEGLICNVLDQMRNDDIAAVARRDRLIILFGSKMYEKTNHAPRKMNEVASKIREVARLLMELNVLFPNKDFNEFIAPQHFNDVIEATRKLTQWDDKTRTFVKPSLALKLGHHLGRLAGFKITEGLRTQNEKEVKDAEQFLSIREREWGDLISTHALRTLHKRKFNKPVILPLVDDIMKMLQYLKTKREEHYTKLSMDCTDRSVWYELSQVTLAQVIMFNRRRSGEAARILLTDYLDRSVSPMQKDILNALSDFEKKLCSKLCRFEVEGKRGRNVPVILTNEMKESVDLLVETRRSVGVHVDNVHLFARPYFNSLDSIRGNDCISKFAGVCEAESPEYITSTNLRKHVGTISQLYNLTESELELLCGFMGHDIRIHRRFYRLPEGTLQVAKLGRILIAMEKGETHLYKGKSLDEIEFDTEELVDEETGEEEQYVSLAEGIENGLPDVIHTSVDIGNPSDSQKMKPDDQRNRNGQKKQKSEHNIETPKPSTCAGNNKVMSGKRSLKNGPPKASSVKVPWTKEESEAVRRSLSFCFREGRVPNKSECDLCKQTESEALHRREWKAIKYYVNNEIKKLNKVKK